MPCFNEIIPVLASTQLRKQFSVLTLEAIAYLWGSVVLSREQSWVNACSRAAGRLGGLGAGGAIPWWGAFLQRRT